MGKGREKKTHTRGYREKHFTLSLKSSNNLWLCEQRTLTLALHQIVMGLERAITAGWGVWVEAFADTFTAFCAEEETYGGLIQWQVHAQWSEWIFLYIGIYYTFKLLRIRHIWGQNDSKCNKNMRKTLLKLLEMSTMCFFHHIPIPGWNGAKKMKEKKKNIIALL